MAHLPQGFDATQHESLEHYEPVPPGCYLAAIVDSEIKRTKRGDGEYLELRFRVLEGEYRGRLIFTRLNLRNPNPQAERMARLELSAICRAVGVLRLADSEDLHGIPVLIDVRQVRRTDNGELANEIRNYSPRDAWADGFSAAADDDTCPF